MRRRACKGKRLICKQKKAENVREKTENVPEKPLKDGNCSRKISENLKPVREKSLKDCIWS